jgi:uncharacterized protein
MKKILKLLALFLVLGVVGLWGAGTYLSKSANHTIVMPTKFTSFEFNGTHGSLLSSDQSHKCALLLHGVRSDRTSMIERAEFLKTLGISSALIDMQAHGETKGDTISFGHFESKDASNGIAYLKSNIGCEKIIVIGLSLGGAAALLGSASQEANALVLESVYPTIEEAVRDRLESKVGKIAGIMAPLLYHQIPLRIAVPIERLRPIEALKSIQLPVYIIGGSLDRSTTPSETLRMYDAVKSSKKIWIVEGAAHQDIYAFTRKMYEQKIREFIAETL